MIKRFFKMCLKKGILFLKLFFKIGLAEVFYLERPDDIKSVISVPGLSFSRITKENVWKVLDFRDEGCLKTFEVYLRQGNYGIFAILNGKVVGHVWAIYSEENDFTASRFITLAKGEILTYYSNVNPIFRGKNIYPAMMAELSRQLFDVFKPKRILGDIEIDNIPAIKGIVKSGFRHLGYANYITICNLITFNKKFYL